MNVGTPEQAFTFAQLPNHGVGLARLEFIINRQIGIHPKALLNLDEQPADVAAEIRERIAAYDSPRDYYIKRLAEGGVHHRGGLRAGTGDCAYVRLQVQRVRQPDWRTRLRAARREPDDRLPRRLTLPGAVLPGLLRPRVRGPVLRPQRDGGLTNVKLMIPFVRTLDEARGVIELLAENGLIRGENGLEVIMMCEIPSNGLLADEFLDYFDGFSIGSNDMTQLALGLDRDSAIVSGGFDERDPPAVKKLLSMAIKACKARGKYVGICGQGPPSDHTDFAEWLVEEGINSVSLNPPDTVVDTWLRLAAVAGFAEVGAAVGAEAN